MLLFKTVCSYFNNTAVNVPHNPINNTNNRVLRNNHTKYFLPRVNITNYNLLIVGRNFYNKSVSDQIKKYDEIRQTATGQGDDQTTRCLFDYHYFNHHYQLIAVGLSKQEELDADSRAVQQMEFYGITSMYSFYKSQEKGCQNFTKEQQKFRE